MAPATCARLGPRHVERRVGRPEVVERAQRAARLLDEPVGVLDDEAVLDVDVDRREPHRGRQAERRLLGVERPELRAEGGRGLPRAPARLVAVVEQERRQPERRERRARPARLFAELRRVDVRVVQVPRAPAAERGAPRGGRRVEPRDIGGVGVELRCDVAQREVEPVERAPLPARERDGVAAQALHDAQPAPIGGDEGRQHGAAVGADEQAVAALVHHGAQPPRDARLLCDGALAVAAGPRRAERLADRVGDRLDAGVRPALVALVEEAVGRDAQRVGAPLEADQCDVAAARVLDLDRAHERAALGAPRAMHPDRRRGRVAPRRRLGVAGRDAQVKRGRAGAAPRADHDEVGRARGARRERARLARRRRRRALAVRRAPRQRDREREDREGSHRRRA